MQMSDSIADLSAALAKAQGAIQQPGKDREVTVQMKKQDGTSAGSYKFKYATLDNIIGAVRPHLAEHGLGFVQFIDAGQMVTRLLHSSGQFMDCAIPFPSLPNKPQEAGSLITYFKRYSFCTALGIVADEDDDANVAQGNGYAPVDRGGQARRRDDNTSGPRPNRDAAVQRMRDDDDARDPANFSVADSMLTVMGKFDAARNKAGLDLAWTDTKVIRAKIRHTEPEQHERLVEHFAKCAKALAAALEEQAARDAKTDDDPPPGQQTIDVKATTASPQNDDVLGDDVPY